MGSSFILWAWKEPCFCFFGVVPAASLSISENKRSSSHYWTKTQVRPARAGAGGCNACPCTRIRHTRLNRYFHTRAPTHLAREDGLELRRIAAVSDDPAEVLVQQLLLCVPQQRLGCLVDRLGAHACVGKYVCTYAQASLVRASSWNSLLWVKAVPQGKHQGKDAHAHKLHAHARLTHTAAPRANPHFCP